MNAPTTTATILVVDDHAALCELIEVILSRAGYRVLTATAGAEALRLARDTPGIDLLVSDLEMPGLRGDEVARRFATLHPSAAIAFVSSGTPPIELALPFEFVPKPFTVLQLCETVRRALRTRPALAETSNAG